MKARHCVRLRLFLVAHGLLPGGLTPELVDAGLRRAARCPMCNDPSARPRKAKTL